MKKVYPRPSKKGTQIRLAPILWASDFTYVVPFIPHDSLTERWYSPYLTIKAMKDQGAKWPAFGHTARNQQSHESDPILTNSEAKLCFPRGGSHGESRVTGPVSLKPPVAWPMSPPVLPPAPAPSALEKVKCHWSNLPTEPQSSSK